MSCIVKTKEGVNRLLVKVAGNSTFKIFKCMSFSIMVYSYSLGNCENYDPYSSCLIVSFV